MLFVVNKPVFRRCLSSIAQNSTPRFDMLLAQHVSSPPIPLTLPALLDIPTPLTPDYVLQSAQTTLRTLPPRMAARIRALEALPYIVGVNPFISRLYQIYRQSFWSLVNEKPVTNLEDNDAFVWRLQNLVESHANDIPTMAKGFQECARYMKPENISSFLDGAIRSRIGTRLIGEHHVALTRSLRSPQPGQLGVVQTACSPREMIRTSAAFVSELCDATLGVTPTIVLDGNVDATFTYIPVHLEYVLTELLKNSYRSTSEHYLSKLRSDRSALLPHIEVTIARTSKFLSIRIRDRGGGIAPSHLPQIFSYAFTTAGSHVEEQDTDGGGPYSAQAVGGSAAMDGGHSEGGGEGSVFAEITGTALRSGLGTIAGLGYGLPLARLYATYFGGDLELVSLYGHGTDVFIKLRSLDAGANVEL